MKLIHFVAIIAILLGIMSTSCKKATYLKIEKDNISFTIKGGEDSVLVSCDADVIVKDSPEWTDVKLDNATLIVTVGDNDDKAKRDGVITLESGDLQATITVTQDFQATHLEVSELEVKMSKEGGTHEVAVDCDGDVMVSAPGFVTATYANGKLHLECAANNEGTKKDSIMLTAGEFTASLAITLEGSICKTCKGTGKVTCSKCKGKGYWEEYSYDEVFESYGAFGCTKCGGRGCWDNVEGDYYSPFHKGSGKVTCPTCNGKGH
ncbi:MAG: hypothetical protein MJZ74_08745 [Muribaculaceae bacterium]|nr:hypothetical protein [Muribaculaceae bacterium]